MAEDVAELETRPAESKRSERPDPAPTRTNDDLSQAKDGGSKHREVREVDKFPAPLPRRPFVEIDRRSCASGPGLAVRCASTRQAASRVRLHPLPCGFPRALQNGCAAAWPVPAASSPRPSGAQSKLRGSGRCRSSIKSL